MTRTQLTSSAADSLRVTKIYRYLTWNDFHPDFGVVELRIESERTRTLQLHVVVDPDTGGSLAWWQTEAGEWLCCVPAGQA